MKSIFAAIISALLFGNCLYTDPQQQTMETKTVSLPAPHFDGAVSVEKALKDRRSVRQYLDKPLALDQVSQLLWAAYGITKEMESPDFLRGGMRTAPSAGARFPLDIYLVAGNVTGLDKGIYKYNSAKHTLELLQIGDKRQELCSAAWDQVFVAQAPASLVYTAVYQRTTSKYGDRGKMRYVCMDLGHSAENVYLQCTAMKLATCAVGAFEDDSVRALLKLPQEEEPLYIMPLGYPRDSK